MVRVLITDLPESDWQRSGGVARAFTTEHGDAREARDGTYVTKRSGVDSRSKWDHGTREERAIFRCNAVACGKEPRRSG